MKAPWIQPTDWIGDGNQYTTWITTANSVCCDGWYTRNGQGQNPLHVFDNGWHSLTSSMPHWIGIYTVEPLEVHEFRFVVNGSSTYVPTQFSFQGSHNGQDWVTLGTYANSSSNTQNIGGVIPEENYGTYHYHRLYITSGGSNYVYVGGLTITALYERLMDSISDTYGWNQPVMTTNEDYGVITCSSYLPGAEAWRAVDGGIGVISKGWMTNDRTDGWWQWKLPTTITVKSIIYTAIYSSVHDYDHSEIYGQFFTGSDRLTPLGESFELHEPGQMIRIPVDNVQTDTIYFYKVGGKYTGIGELQINALEEKTTGCWVDITKAKMIYGEGHACVHAYKPIDTLMWYDPNYKYYYRDWPFPSLTDDFSYGVLNSSSRNEGNLPYKALDGVDYSTDVDQGYNSFITKGTAPQWWMWQLPHPIVVRKIEFKNNYSADGSRSKTLQFFADEQMTIPIGEEFTCPDSDGGTIEIVPYRPVIVQNIFCYIKSGTIDNSTVGIGEIKITGRYRGQEVQIISGTKYNIPTLENNGRLEATTDIEVVTDWFDWQQPRMTSEDSYGLLTCDSVALPNYVYSAFDNTMGTQWLNQDYNSGWIQWQLPQPLKLQSFQIYGTGDPLQTPTTIEVLGSNNGESWVTLTTYENQETVNWDSYFEVPVNAEQGYTYIRWNFPVGNMGSTTGVGIGEIRITGQMYETRTYINVTPASDFAVRVSSNESGTDGYKLFDNNINSLGWQTTETEWIPNDYIDYQEEWISWTRPNFLSNDRINSEGLYRVSASNTLSGHEAYMTMDNEIDEQTYWDSGQHDITDRTPAWIQFESPVELDITQVIVTNASFLDGNPRDIEVLTTLDGGTTWLIMGKVTNCTNGPDVVNTIPITNRMKNTLFRISIPYSHTYDNVRLADIQIIATKKNIKEVPVISQCPWIITRSNLPIMVNGLTFYNNTTGIKKFEWYYSTNGDEYISLGTYYTPNFSQQSGAIYNVGVATAPTPQRFYKMRIWETWNSDNKIRLNELKYNAYSYVGRWLQWMQPAVRDNIVYGSITASSELGWSNSPYLAVNSTVPITVEDSWLSNTVEDSWWMWKLPDILKLKSIDFYNTYDASYTTSKVQLFLDEGITPMSAEVEVSSVPGTPTTIEIPDIITDTIYVKCMTDNTSNLGVGIGELIINAEKLYTMSSTTSVWREWVQPVFGSNTTWGTITASSQYGTCHPYKALVPDWSYMDDSEWQTNEVTKGWWNWQFAEPLRVSGLRFYQQGTTNYYSTKVTIYEDSTKEKVVVPEFEPPLPSSELTVPDYEPYNSIYFDIEPQVLNGLYIEVEGSEGVGIGFIALKAEYEYEVVPEGWVLWNQPTFTSNTTWGVLTASSERRPAWRALDNSLGGVDNYSGIWETDNETLGWWNWQFAQPLRLQNIRIYQRTFSDTYHISTVSVYEDTSKNRQLAVNLPVPQQVDGYVDIDGQDQIFNSLYIEVEGPPYVGIGEIEITAYYEESR